jgi:DNA-binding GntR family transcriptional regulator
MRIPPSHRGTMHYTEELKLDEGPFIQLAGQGLFRQRARYGYWLVTYDAEDIQQILRMRAGVEAMVADALCALRASTDESSLALDESAWEEVQNIHAGMGQLAGRGSEEGLDHELEAEFGDQDTELHACLARAGMYDVAARHIVEWRNQLRIFALQHDLRYARDDLATIHAEHARLLAAIDEGDRSLASDLASTHVDNATKRRLSRSPETARVLVGAARAR